MNLDIVLDETAPFSPASFAMNCLLSSDNDTSDSDYNNSKPNNNNKTKLKEKNNNTNHQKSTHLKSQLTQNSKEKRSLSHKFKEISKKKS